MSDDIIRGLAIALGLARAKQNLDTRRRDRRREDEKLQYDRARQAEQDRMESQKLAAYLASQKTLQELNEAKLSQMNSGKVPVNQWSQMDPYTLNILGKLDKLEYLPKSEFESSVTPGAGLPFLPLPMNRPPTVNPPRVDFVKNALAMEAAKNDKPTSLGQFGYLLNALKNEPYRTNVPDQGAGLRDVIREQYGIDIPAGATPTGNTPTEVVRNENTAARTVATQEKPKTDAKKEFRKDWYDAQQGRISQAAWYEKYPSVEYPRAAPKTELDMERVTASMARAAEASARAAERAASGGGRSSGGRSSGGKSTGRKPPRQMSQANRDKAAKLGFNMKAITYGPNEVLANMGYFSRRGWFGDKKTEPNWKEIQKRVKIVNKRYEGKGIASSATPEPKTAKSKITAAMKDPAKRRKIQEARKNGWTDEEIAAGL